MSNKSKMSGAKEPVDNNTTLSNFRIDRIKKLKNIYSDEQSSRRRFNDIPFYSAVEFKSAAEVRKALSDLVNKKDLIVQTSQKLYSINPIYSEVINYLSNMFLWRYKVIPHKVYSKSKAKLRKVSSEEDFQIMYNLMLEVADGLSIETKFPALLTLLYTNGAVYLTTISDEDSISLDTILLPDKFCRKVGETQFGTAIIEFDFSYFDGLGLTQEQLNEYFKSFPKEFKANYNKYKKNARNRWSALDPRFSTGILLNDMGIPTFFYLLGGLLDYEQYQDNELRRNENLLKYLIVQKMPIYENQLIFEVDEVEAIHKSLKSIVDRDQYVRLITTYGDIHKEQLGESDAVASEVLAKSFKAIFNNAGFNDNIFTGDSVESIRISLNKDKNFIWKHVRMLLSFYNIAINNWFDFKDYQADIDILPISLYTYNDDIDMYKTNATLGIGKLDYFIASGIKQKHVQDQLNLESFLKLDQIVPMQTSYTQTAEDRIGTESTNGNKGSGDNSNSNDKEATKENSGEKSAIGASESGIEPTDNDSKDSN